LKIGSRLSLWRLGDGLVILSEQRRFDQLCERIRSTLMAVDLTAEEVLATLPEVRIRVYAHRYGHYANSK